MRSGGFLRQNNESTFLLVCSEVRSLSRASYQLGQYTLAPFLPPWTGNGSEAVNKKVRPLSPQSALRHRESLSRWGCVARGKALTQGKGQIGHSSVVGGRHATCCGRVCSLALHLPAGDLYFSSDHTQVNGDPPEPQTPGPQTHRFFTKVFSFVVCGTSPSPPAAESVNQVFTILLNLPHLHVAFSI
jgi:hypothetical protein